MKRIFVYLAVLAAALLAAQACKQQDQKGSLVVMSYNIRNAKAADGDNDWEHRKEATTAMLNAIKPDVFGIQEAYPVQEDYILQNNPEYKGYGIGRDDGKNVGERMTVFYRHEVLKLLACGTWWLSETPDEPSFGWDARCRRTATWARLKHIATGKEFFFVNTHLDHVGVEARRNGLALIVNKVGEMCPGAALILTGDFNVEPGDECLNSLESLEMLDARSTAAETEDKPSFNGFGDLPATIIDYIYYRGFSGVEKFRVVDETFADKPYISDHYPIMAVLDF